MYVLYVQYAGNGGLIDNDTGCDSEDVYLDDQSVFRDSESVVRGRRTEGGRWCLGSSKLWQETTRTGGREGVQ
jgi:hypothetical protein